MVLVKASAICDVQISPGLMLQQTSHTGLLRWSLVTLILPRRFLRTFNAFRASCALGLGLRPDRVRLRWGGVQGLASLPWCLPAVRRWEPRRPYRSGGVRRALSGRSGACLPHWHGPPSIQDGAVLRVWWEADDVTAACLHPLASRTGPEYRRPSQVKCFWLGWGP